VEIYQVLELIIEEQGTQTSTLGFGGSDPKWKYIKYNTL